MTPPPSPAARVNPWGTRLLNAIRGALIGVAETVPGVSGGTIALMTGVYEVILTSAGHFITGARVAVVDVVRGRGVSRAREDLRYVRWEVLIPLGLGMVVALVAMARVMEGLVSEHPEVTRALFFGLVLASIVVPYRLAAHSVHRVWPMGRWSGREVLIAGGAAIAAALIVSLPRVDLDATPMVLIPAGAITISALVLPGLSGSFLLLTMGLYESTLSAVNDRDFGYLALFALGCVIGLVSIVKALQWLLENRRRITLVILTGVMAGSLRALWPWVDDNNQLLAPTQNVLAAVLAAVLGVAAVAAVLITEKRIMDRARRLDDNKLESGEIERREVDDRVAE